MIVMKKDEFDRRLKRLHDQAYQLMFDAIGVTSTLDDEEVDEHYESIEHLEEWIRSYQNFLKKKGLAK